MNSMVNQTSNLKSSSLTSTPSNRKTISGSATSVVTPICNFVGNFMVLVFVVGGRKDAEVAGRASMRDPEAGTLRNVEAMRPAAVAGRVGGFICGNFFVGPIIGVGTTRAACRGFEEMGSADRFRG